MVSNVEAIQVGPFTGGLNLFSDPTSVADNEVVECLNFELDLDGSLVSRPPFVDLDIDFTLDNDEGNMRILGYYNAPGGLPYLIASDGKSTTYYFNGSAWVELTDTISATAMVQFNDQAWLLSDPDAANPGGYWNPDDGFTAVSDMPRGDVLLAYKFRLWVATGKDAEENGTRLYFSDLLGETPFWPAVPGFIDVGAGDGQNIIAATVYFNSILVFRSDSVYTFQYTSDPSSGTSSVLLAGIGLTSKECLVSFESFLYFVYQDRAYEFINNRASQINVKVPFEAVSQSGLYLDIAVSSFNNRIIFSYYDTLYVFSLRTRTWTRWRTTLGPIGKIIPMAGSEQRTALCHRSAAIPDTATRSTPLLQVSDDLSVDASEEFECVMRTKNYNYSASSVFKKLSWWGADAIFRGTVTAVATPIVHNFTTTWGALLSSGATWGSLLSFTWGAPSTGLSSVETVRDTTGSSATRKFVKFRKTLRFRQINFQVTFDTDGTVNTAPVRLFALMTYVKANQRVVKAIS